MSQKIFQVCQFPDSVKKKAKATMENNCKLTYSGNDCKHMCTTLMRFCKCKSIRNKSEGIENMLKCLIKFMLNAEFITFRFDKVFSIFLKHIALLRFLIAGYVSLN